MTVMDDLISRQAAINAILHNQEVYSNNFGTDAIDKYTMAIIDNDVQTIAQLPPAEAEPVRRGKWIEIDYPVSECSICKYMVDTLNIATSYCPNCGAKMEGD